MSEKGINLENVWGEPIVHKGVPIHPIKMRDCDKFFENVRCLMLEKNKSQDIEILKMSYISFLFRLVSEGHKYLLNSLSTLIELTTGYKPLVNVNEKGRIILIIPIKVWNEELKEYEIVDKVWTENDFDKFKKKIFEQNLIRMDKEILDPELEKKMNEAREFMSRRGGKMADLEQQIIAYHCEFKLPYEEIAKLTIYQFQKGIQRISLMKEASAILNARYSGFVSFKDESKLPNWLSYIADSDPDSDIIMSKGDFDKMASENGLIDS